MARDIHLSDNGELVDEDGDAITLGALVAGPANTYTQTYSTANRTVAAPTAATPALTAANPAALTAAALTDNSAGTANTTVEALADGTTYANDVAAIRNNFADLAAMVNKLTVDLTATRAEVVKLVTDLTATNAEVTKLVADDLDNRQTNNAIIDDLQALGAVS